jgi:hypothetical protein
MKTGIKSNLAVSEISGIWSSYSQNNLNIHVLDYFLAKVKDTEILSFLQDVKNIYMNRNIRLENIFKREGLSMPHGYTDADVNTETPNLFVDDFFLWYLNIIIYFEMTIFTFILNNISDTELLEYFSNCITETIDLYNQDVDLLTAKGLFINAPKVEIHKEVTYVKNNSFLGSWFGQSRSMLASESTVIYTEVLYNIISRAIFSGFGQVSKLKEVREFMFKGRDIATDQIKDVSKMSNKENIPVPSTSDSFITNSTTPPFSDKLMMNISLVLIELLLINCDAGIIASFRKDIQLDNIQHVTQYGKYALEGIKIMISNGWLEKPPQIVISENLVGV